VIWRSATWRENRPRRLLEVRLSAPGDPCDQEVEALSQLSQLLELKDDGHLTDRAFDLGLHRSASDHGRGKEQLESDA
jgi:hypothetical protein